MPTPEVPLIATHPEDFKVPENLQIELKAIETSPKINIQLDNAAQPIISTSSSGNATIQPQANLQALIQKAKGKVGDAATWLAKFLLRLIAKKNYASNTT